MCRAAASAVPPLTTTAAYGNSKRRRTCVGEDPGHCPAHLTAATPVNTATPPMRRLQHSAPVPCPGSHPRRRPHMRLPTTPATTGPECSPTRMRTTTPSNEGRKRSTA
jgi:hypothetical protein